MELILSFMFLSYLFFVMFFKLIKHWKFKYQYKDKMKRKTKKKTKGNKVIP